MFCHCLFFSAVNFDVYKPVSQSCTVGKSEKFWQATGQSNLVDSIKHCSTGKSAVLWELKPKSSSFCCGQPFVCQVWLSSGPPECFAFSDCALLWNWLITFSAQNQIWIKLVLYLCLLIKTDHKASANLFLLLSWCPWKYYIARLIDNTLLYVKIKLNKRLFYDHFSIMYTNKVLGGTGLSWKRRPSNWVEHLAIKIY